jgi:hypothetical protein
MDPATQELVASIARSFSVHECHRFHELPDGSVLYVSRDARTNGFTAATVVGDVAQCDFMRQLQESRPRRGMPPPYASTELDAFEAELGGPLPPLLRTYLGEVSRGWRSRPFSPGTHTVDLRAGRLSTPDAPDAPDGIGKAVDLTPGATGCSGGGVAVLVSGKGHGLAVRVDPAAGTEEERLRMVPLWSVMFETFF